QMTPGEKALWFELRQRKLEGTHFRRQSVIGPFVVDFASHGAMLVVELDGGVHLASDVELRDDERSRWLEGRGYKIMRFSNADVLKNAAEGGDQILIQARARLRVIGMMRAHARCEARENKNPTPSPGGGGRGGGGGGHPLRTTWPRAGMGHRRYPTSRLLP